MRGCFFAIGLLLWADAIEASLDRPADQKPSEHRVQVSVVVILGSEKDDKVDRKLTGIAQEVRKMHPRVKGFRMVNLSSRSLAIGTASEFDLVEKQKVSVTVEAAADSYDRVRLKVGPPLMGQITYSTPCGKFLPIVTPFRTASNDLLILAIRVQPCGKK
jgi:hypothetical protein